MMTKPAMDSAQGYVCEKPRHGLVIAAAAKARIQFGFSHTQTIQPFGNDSAFAIEGTTPSSARQDTAIDMH